MSLSSILRKNLNKLLKKLENMISPSVENFKNFSTHLILRKSELIPSQNDFNNENVNLFYY